MGEEEGRRSVKYLVTIAIGGGLVGLAMLGTSDVVWPVSLATLGGSLIGGCSWSTYPKLGGGALGDADAP